MKHWVFILVIVASHQVVWAATPKRPQNHLNTLVQESYDHHRQMERRMIGSLREEFAAKTAPEVISESGETTVHRPRSDWGGEATAQN